jgi:hypothetical protein
MNTARKTPQIFQIELTAFAIKILNRAEKQCPYYPYHYRQVV